MKSKTRKITIILIIITLLAPSFFVTASLAKEEINSNYQKTKEEENIESDESIEEGEGNLSGAEGNTEVEEDGAIEKDETEKKEQEEDSNKAEVKPEENNNLPLEEQEEVETEIEEIDTRQMKAVPNTSKELPEGDGVYFISTALDNSKVLDIGGGSTANGANVQLWGNTNVKQQKFEMLYNQQLDRKSVV